MKKVDIQTVQRLVWRLANQLPTRYYLNYMGEPTHFVIEIWEHWLNPFPDKLDKELKALGFDFKEKVNLDHYILYQWIAEREKVLTAEEILSMSREEVQSELDRAGINLEASKAKLREVLKESLDKP